LESHLDLNLISGFFRQNFYHTGTVPILCKAGYVLLGFHLTVTVLWDQMSWRRTVFSKCLLFYATYPTSANSIYFSNTKNFIPLWPIIQWQHPLTILCIVFRFHIKNLVITTFHQLTKVEIAVQQHLLCSFKIVFILYIFSVECTHPLCSWQL